MTGIPNRPAARSLPSRSNFAIFRLIGYFRSRGAPDQVPVPGTLTIDAGQNTLEEYAVALWVLLAATCYCAAALASFMSLPLAIAIAVVVAPMAVPIPSYVTGGFVMPLWRRVSGRKDRNNIRQNSFMTMAVFLAASAWFAMRHEWTTSIAIASLSLAVLNAAAAVVMWLLRGRVREMEKRCAA